MVIRKGTLLLNPSVPNQRPVHVGERNVNYGFPNTISKRQRTGVTYTKFIKDNKIQNRHRSIIYISATPLDVISIASQSKTR